MKLRETIVKRLLKLVVIFACLYAFLYWNNHWLIVTQYTYESEKVPAKFDGLRIVQISDLHDALFGERNETLIAKVRQAEPDIIFLTGDMIDSNRLNLEQSLEAVRGLIQIADVYYVLGNHEVATNRVSEIYAKLKALGVNILPNTSVMLERNGEQIAIVGIEDPLMNPNTANTLEMALVDVPKDMFTLLLAHRPEMFPIYVDYKMDMVFSGHAHGGQFRIPGVGGLIAPGQGWLPKYTSGIYARSGTQMIVSRGLGNSGVPQRVFNLPQIVVVELKSK